MGEAWKKKRAAGFRHRASIHYELLVADSLLRLARKTKMTPEITARLMNGHALRVGDNCLLQPDGSGGHQVVHGNLTVAQLSPEAQDAVRGYAETAPALSGFLLCHVTRIGAFGVVTLELDLGNKTDD